MKGIVVNYRMGRHTQNPRQMIIKVEGIENKEQADKLAGHKVIWTSPGGKELTGTVSGAHGNKGIVRARFVKGLPGQAIGSEVIIQ
ncbi:MAG: 50S ribosomal protein L35ae [Candidatus Altiarchaeota archaeon]|nr:50S ribosomal protein L35ae [Candidatus Altiarchaeota archaeon]